MSTEIDKINVELSYKIIELFSAGLYSSPNKAFEELICNSYDAFASIVSVFVSPDRTSDNSFIMVCDNGEGIDQAEFHNLWKIGESDKRKNPDRDKRRLQIGRFGIGKLSTYILARKLTHLSKKDGRYISVTMDYGLIHEETKDIALPEIELNESEVRALLEPYLKQFPDGDVGFDLFGENASSTWTISLMTQLKPKALELQIGRLKWILSTALPLSSNAFILYLNGKIIESSKTKIPVLKEWILGKEDQTAEELDFATPCYDEANHTYFVNFDSLPHVEGKMILYEESLLGGKAAENGRSHGIFLSIRGRLINLDDPLLGMEPFSHGPFNHCQIIVQADGLDDNLTSTREAVKDSEPYRQLKTYIKKKFNNELRSFYFENEEQKQLKKSVSYRLSQTGYSTSLKPIRSFISRCNDGSIANPLLISKPTLDSDTLLRQYASEGEGTKAIIEDVKWSILGSNDPIARLNIDSKILTINLLHPFVANYIDSYKNNTPLENIAITEILTEAFLYEIGIEESQINAIIRKRDNTLRELAFSDKEGIPAVAQLLYDALSDVNGLENAVCRSLSALGFDAYRIGGNGKPDGFASAVLGSGSDGTKKSYTLTFDAKSTSAKKISASTAKLSGLKRHQNDYNATYCLEVAIGYEGEDDPESAISVEAKREQVTVMKASDLAQLLLYSIPNHLGLTRLQDLFKTCYAPIDVTKWVTDFVNDVPERAPYSEIVDIIYDFQKNDNEPPTLEVIRLKLNDLLDAKYSSSEVAVHLKALDNIIPGQFHFDGKYVSIDVKPEIIKSHITQAINSSPLPMRELYNALFN